MSHRPPPSPLRQRPYRRTLGDRLGPDAGHLYKAAGWTAFGSLMIIPVALYHVPAAVPAVIGVPLAFLLCWAFLFGISLLLIKPGADVAKYYLLPSGASTPYEEQFSQEEALVMQGRVPAALALYEARIAAHPADARARIRAAELYAGPAADPARAAYLLREVQRIPGLPSGQELYVGNRLADLYLGPLGTPARALVELRRLLDRYPDSRLAPQLRSAIAKLKAEHVADPRTDAAPESNDPD
ncbi:MAG: hypothetical protein KGL38_14345 [Gemmatimonadota bacterium]|nr:hypothetical protein [Gemmatimonadota bacterium]MDE3129186.1 hypothetical protein [Gemmatimonadota bacterium]MDE3171719.1 hypothetical protein [Gemmatimonadota bacterium]MDE3215360.1 hypothetical protein [Gemmatimonadota bacterium]